MYRATLPAALLINDHPKLVSLIIRSTEPFIRRTFLDVFFVIIFYDFKFLFYLYVKLLLGHLACCFYQYTVHKRTKLSSRFQVVRHLFSPLISQLKMFTILSYNMAVCNFCKNYSLFVRATG